MGIMDLFSGIMGNNQQQAQPPQQTNQQPGAGQPGSIPPAPTNETAISQGTAPNGTIPAESTQPENKTPLDDFVDIWNTPAVDPNAPPKSNSVFGKVDPKKFAEAAGKIDFSKVVNPEQLKSISQGGDSAVQAFAQAMNSVAQAVYAQSSFATTRIVDAALAKAKEGMVAELPDHIRRQQVSETLRSSNALYSNPAVKPIITALESQLTVKYPNATAAEISKQAQKYIDALATTFKPADITGGKESSQKKRGETDWGEFLQL